VSDNIPEDSRERLICFSYRVAPYHGLNGRARDAVPRSAAMRINSHPTKLATAGQACRAQTYQEERPAGSMENPATRGPLENAARRYYVFAEKLEAARRHAQSNSPRGR
jgi:hypothetical protein